MEQFRKFNAEENRIILDNKYLFAFTTSDGFTERLLRAELLINYDYEYVFELNAFDHEKITNNNSNSIVEKGILNDKMLNWFESLLESDYLTLKKIYDYETFTITDIGDQQYLINLENKTTNIYIIDSLPEEYFKSNTEKILFEFNNYLKNWVEEKYKNWIKK